MLSNITFLMIFAVFHPSPLKLWINCSFYYHHIKFRKDRSNCCGYIVIFVIFKMAAAAILDFQKFEILMVGALKGANMRHRAKFHQNRSNGCRDTAI